MKKFARHILAATAGIAMLASIAVARAADPKQIGTGLWATGPAGFLGGPGV